MSLSKDDMQKCCNDINNYFNGRYSNTEKFARLTTEDSGAIIIYFERFNTLIISNREKVIDQPVGMIILWMNEHIDQFIEKYQIPKERIIYATYDFLPKRRYDYIVYRDTSLSLELDSTKFNQYVRALPKLK